MTRNPKQKLQLIFLFNAAVVFLINIKKKTFNLLSQYLFRTVKYNRTKEFKINIDNY